jgi:uncharacterized membrane protein YdbT with pleckstrin-like domain
MTIDNSKMKDFNWKGKPDFKPYLAKSFIVLLASGLFIGITYTLVYFIQNSTNAERNPWIVEGFIAFIALQGIFLFAKRLIEFKNIEYQINNDCIKITTQFITKNVKIINKNKIQSIEVKRTIIDRCFNVNTIQFYSGKLTKGYEDQLKKELDKFEYILNSAEIIMYLGTK